MANQALKGLTVEIGANTSGLLDALKDVEKKGKSLSSELGQINKLLKLDPSNTELLAQKQKVLADAISNTEEKLDTLREAEKQAQEQVKKGKITEAQYRAIQREIVATEAKLKSYGRAVDDTNDQLKQHGNAADKAADDVDELAEAAQDADRASEGLGSSLAGAAKVGLAAVGAAVGAVVGGLTAAAENSREYRTEMGKLAAGFDVAGHSAKSASETYETLQGVIGETDQSVEAAQQIALLANSEKDAAQWAGLAAGVVGRFGDALQPETFFEAANETIKLGEATGAYTQLLEGTGYSVEKFNEGLAECNTEAEKQAYMLKITDKLLGDAADKYNEANAEVIRANEANEQWMQSLAGVGGAVEPILTDVKMLGASLLEDLVPGVQTVADAFRGILNGDEGATDQLAEGLSSILTTLMEKISTMLPGIVQTVASLLSSLLPQLINIMADLIPVLLTTLSAQLPTLLQALIEGFSQILVALGDMMPELIPVILDAILLCVDTLLDNVDQLVDSGIVLLMGLADGLIAAIPSLIDKIPIILDKLINAVTNNLPKLVSAGIQLTLKLAAGLIKAIPQLVSKIPQIFKSLLAGFKNYYSKMGEIGKDLIKGLWNGIKDMTGWITDKLSGFGESILGGIKDFFGIKSPSRVMAREVGKFLPEGLAKGVLDNEDTALDAMTSLSNDMLGEAEQMNGLTIERQLHNTFAPVPRVEMMASGLLDKLDSILTAIEKGQILTIDGDTLVGATANRMDNALGQRRALAARGAI